MLQARRHFREAEALNREVLSRFEREFGQDHPETLIAEDCLAGCLEAEGVKLGEAEARRRHVLIAREANLGRSHRDTLVSVDKAAVLLASLGEIEEAERLGRRALESRVVKLGSENADTLRSARQLAGFLKDLGGTMQLVEAHALLQEAKTGQEILLGLDHPETIQCVHMLGSVLASLGEISDAVAEYRKALQLLQKTVGPDAHATLEVAQDLSALLEAEAIIEDQRGKSELLDEAENLARYVAGKRQSAMAANSTTVRSPAAVDSESQVACLLALNENTAEAGFFFSRVLGSDPDRQRTLEGAHDQACSIEALGKHDQAAQVMRKVANDIVQRNGGPESPEALGALCNLGGSLSLLQDGEEEAENFFTEAVENFYLSSTVRFNWQMQEVDGDSMQALDGLIRLLEVHGSSSEAEILLRKRLSECYRLYGQDHPETYETMHRLAATLIQAGHGQDDLDEARQLLQRELEGVEDVCGTAYQDDSLLIHVQLDNLKRRGVAYR